MAYVQTEWDDVRWFEIQQLRFVYQPEAATYVRLQYAYPPHQARSTRCIRACHARRTRRTGTRTRTRTTAHALDVQLVSCESPPGITRTSNASTFLSKQWAFSVTWHYIVSGTHQHDTPHTAIVLLMCSRSFVDGVAA
jgi:hypothetical protein